MWGDKYYSPIDIEGVGSDIKWCNRHSGGKFCLLCKNKVSFDVWSNKWHWHYLLSWNDAEGNYPWLINHVSWKWRYSWHFRDRKKEVPHYSSTGLSSNDFKSLLKKGCSDKKKCKCMSLVQRGNWYCPTCHMYIESIAKHNGLHKHDVMLMDRLEVKADALILLLSGAL